MNDVILSHAEFTALKRRCSCHETTLRMNQYLLRANKAPKETAQAEPKARKK